MFVFKKIKWNGNKYGFTLLEILVVIIIFSLIISMISPAFTGTFRTIEIVESESEIYEMARTAFIRMVEDLESAYIPEDTQDPQAINNDELLMGENDYLEGRRADKIRFCSRAHIDISETPFKAGEAKIAYYPLLKEDGTISLYRSDTPGMLDWPEEDTGGWVMCEGLYSISFTYTDNNDDTYDQWDDSIMGSQKKLPSIIKITLEFMDKDDPENPLTFSTAVFIPLANM